MPLQDWRLRMWKFNITVIAVWLVSSLLPSSWRHPWRGEPPLGCHPPFLSHYHPCESPGFLFLLYWLLERLLIITCWSVEKKMNKYKLFKDYSYRLTNNFITMSRCWTGHGVSNFGFHVDHSSPRPPWWCRCSRHSSWMLIAFAFSTLDCLEVGSWSLTPSRPGSAGPLVAEGLIVASQSPIIVSLDRRRDTELRKQRLKISFESIYSQLFALVYNV